MKFNTFKVFLYSIMCFQGTHCDFPFFKGRWSSSSNVEQSSSSSIITNNHENTIDTSSSTPYFQFKDSKLFAVRDNAKLSMDIKNIGRSNENNHLQFQLANLKVHSVPLYFSIFDYRIVSFVRLLMKHGLTIEFHSISKDDLVVKWIVRDNDRVLQKGKLLLSNIGD